jgi:hypothetical protein
MSSAMNFPIIAQVFQLLPPQIREILPYVQQAEVIENTIIILFVVRRLIAIHRRECAIERRLTVIGNER